MDWEQKVSCRKSLKMRSKEIALGNNKKPFFVKGSPLHFRGMNFTGQFDEKHLHLPMVYELKMSEQRIRCP